VRAGRSSAHLEKELAGSALAQHHTSKQTSATIGSLAARLLGDPHACAEAKELAGSVLAQVRRMNAAAHAALIRTSSS